jgi:very-short-patch-repair endonuclease
MRSGRDMRNVAIDVGDRRVTVDVLFPAQRVVVELDGERFHRTRRDFHADRERDAALAALGYVVVRLTWRRVTGDAGGVAAQLRRTLALRPSGRG